MKKIAFLLIGGVFLFSCQNNNSSNPEDIHLIQNDKVASSPGLSLEEAHRLAQLPMNCIQSEYPNKLGQTLGSAEDIAEPSVLHPAFYGCFDWHSSVHGHWSLVKLLKSYPELEGTDEIKKMLEENLSQQNLEKELEYFQGKYNGSYERTYGWAWLLKLSAELKSWEDPLGSELASNLEALTQKILSNYMAFLPNLRYAIRVGEHTNTAFGLSLAWDYAEKYGEDSLLLLIKNKAKEFYLADEGCPLDWEPSGYDFLSPCLEEIDLMRRVLERDEFLDWMQHFAPQMLDDDFKLAPGEVIDRTDGKLVHLDGLNFSRAWVLYGLVNSFPEYGHLKKIADTHVAYSLPSLTDGNYEGEHWLASFAIYALAQLPQE